MFKQTIYLTRYALLLPLLNHANLIQDSTIIKETLFILIHLDNKSILSIIKNSIERITMLILFERHPTVYPNKQLIIKISLQLIQAMLQQFA